MAWMRMPGGTWPGAAASFLDVCGRDDGRGDACHPWRQCCKALPTKAVGRTGEIRRLGRLTALVGVAYFFMATVFGMAAFPLGVALAAVEMRLPALARAEPFAVGVVVLNAGSLQFTAWKARRLACCRDSPGRGRTLPAEAGTAWRHGACASAFTAATAVSV